MISCLSLSECRCPFLQSTVDVRFEWPFLWLLAVDGARVTCSIETRRTWLVICLDLLRWVR